MKKQVEETLQCLIGQPFWGAGRTLNLLSFQFGPRQLRTRRGKTYEVGTYALHVQCSWRLTSAQHILVASDDRFAEPLEESIQATQEDEDEAYTWDRTNTTLLDERLHAFFLKCQETPCLVQSIHADNLGGFNMELSQDYTLTVFPNFSNDTECWRFFRSNDDRSHFVVTGEGILDQED